MNNKLNNNTQSLQPCVSGSVTASDFRIGNVVEHISSNICIVESIFKTGQLEVSVTTIMRGGFFNKKYSIVNIDEIKPINLSEKWMRVFDFQFKHSCWEREKGKIALFLDGNLWFKQEIIHWNMNNVHELQNIYFSLFGVDLDIQNLTDG
jgi:hypothetical protein